MRGRVLVVDDQLRARRVLVNELKDAGFEVVEAGDGAMAWRQFQRSRPDAVITDLVMPKSDGLDLLGRIRACSEVPVIVFTAYGTPQAATDAMKTGAEDFICSPDVEIDELVAKITDAVAGNAVPAGEAGFAERLAGGSRPIVRVRERLAALAPLRTPVLVAGEPGTGRSSAVRALHELGSSSGGRLARLTPRQPLLGVQAPPPTAIYLDDVDRFPPDARAHWTRTLGTAAAGGFRQPPRILASATGSILDLSVDEGFERGIGRTLLRFAIEMPPLREIAEDLPSIATRLMERAGAAVGRSIGLSAAAMHFLESRTWPGNAAQLERVLERAISFSRGRQVRRDVVADVVADLEESLDGIRAREAIRERNALIRSLQQSGGNITRAAEELGRSRASIYRMIGKHGIPLRRPPR